MSELVDKLFGSDAASALTNQAARRIEELEGTLRRIVSLSDYASARDLGEMASYPLEDD